MSKIKIKQLLKRASSHLRKGEVEAALSLYSSVLAIDPDNYLAKTALQARGIALTPAADPPDAERRSLVMNYNQGNFRQVVTLGSNLMTIYPKSRLVWKMVASAQASLNNFSEAIAAFQTLVALDPDDPDGYLNLGAALQDNGQFSNAADNYLRALELNPNYVKAHFNLGNALKEQGNWDGAINCYRQAIKLSPDFADAHGELANALYRSSDFGNALAHYQTALRLSPHAIQFEVKMRYVQQHVCDFSVYDHLPDLLNKLDSSSDANWSPFVLLSWEDNPKGQLARSKKFMQNSRGVTPLSLPSTNRQDSDRIRVGYFSADFHDHATLFLMAGLLREHDRDKFEIIAYSYGKNKGGAWRKQAMQDVEHFHDVAQFTDAEIAALARSHSLDIAIDLKGFTTLGRLSILGHRLAPVQISYLGYPGSLGTNFIDYIVADPVLIPAKHRDAYSESVIYMPHTYQPTDNARPISDMALVRADYGLPEDTFVLCSFNNSYKIGRREFRIWMEILREVENSVLWMLKSNEWAVNNLRREAKLMGVDPSRLIFAERASQAEHLARHRLADLFLDSFYYNAHTTASDALWGGLPIVTKLGEQFAARVAGSILTAAGLDQLITHSDNEYKNTIKSLAINPNRMRDIREKISHGLLRMPLFDTVRYTRNFEKALIEANKIYMEGGEPRDIAIEDPA